MTGTDRKFIIAALDMDGTLLTPDKQLLPETAADIAAFAEAGGVPVFCSGRTATEIAPYRGQLPSMRYAVCESGALVWDYEEGRALSARPMELSDVLRIVEVSDRYDGMLQFLTPEGSWVRSDQVVRMADYLMGAYQPTYLKVARLADDMTALASRLPQILKTNIYCRSPEDRLICHEALRGLPFTFAYTETAALEMTAPGVDKGSGLKILASSLGIPMEQVMGVGDAGNDLEMLRCAGLAVAMGNATDEVKAVCDIVTADNLNNGAGLALRRLSGLL